MSWKGWDNDMERWDDLSPEQRLELLNDAVLWAGRRLLEGLGHEVPEVPVEGIKRVDGLKNGSQPRYSDGFEPTFLHDPFIDGLRFNDKGYPEDAP